MKKATLTNKITAITLVIMLLAGLIPTVALPVVAAETQEVSSYTELAALVEVGGDIRLTADIELEAEICFSANTTLDLNGYTISFADPESSFAIGAFDSISLTVNDSSAEGTGKITMNSSAPDASAIYAFGNFTELHINGGTIESNNFNIYCRAAVLEITGGTFIGSCEALDPVGSTELNITGGSFSNDPSSYLGDGYEATYNESTGYYDVTGAPETEPEEGSIPEVIYLDIANSELSHGDAFARIFIPGNPMSEGNMTFVEGTIYSYPVPAPRVLNTLDLQTPAER